MEATQESPKSNGKRSYPTLMPERLGLEEDKMHRYVVDVPVSVEIEDLKQSSFWAHVSEGFEVSDHIVVRREDMAWVVHGIVTDCGRNYARIHIYQIIQLETARDTPMTAILHEVVFKGPQLKFCVVRKSDAKMLQSGMKKEQAFAWMIDHERQQR